ncbi:WecB/TagA/CpsF family glycosyltransferase [Curtobacterium sp. ZW137]|uniref:WecB/TagA/CpsF family glycosyltransferase n=1 Tax=Curtobacterium sp. ZW137 TaxID=2485104 RepID=UPI000F4BA28D|nr:WecB/TagA/CpsF family glycosyltransferase [Curtobacterium sp. ZW137]ROP65054.1 N-acetylglucosaminyldiphosphoundecaprenol N-acetyl-beta-D-mannosaminyltransferase [Curtobacterium sp. ZW137]
MTAKSSSHLQEMRRRPLGGLSLIAARPEQASRAVIEASKAGGGGRAVHFLNAYSLALAQSDGEFRSTLQTEAHNFPDGKPLSWVTRWSAEPLHQVRGPQFFLDVMNKGRASDVRHFLLGGSQDLLDKLERNLTDLFPGVLLVGSFSPPFRQLAAEEILAQDALIRESEADIVWVGLGTPKQDFEVQRLAAELHVVACAVGAAFDFTAKTKREAPRWMTSVGLEWLYRLLSEPRRLWKRYLIGNFVFLRAILRDH